VWARAEPLLRRAGLAWILHRTAGRGAATGIGAELAASEPDVTVLCVGGDGTVHEVANGLLRGGLDRPRPTLAILPAGSGNDFARQLGIPRDMAAWARLMAAGPTRAIDAGHLGWAGGGEWFLNVASFGFTGATALVTDRMGKRLGGLSYVVGAVRAIAGHRDYSLRIGLDGEPPRPVRLCAGVLANAAWFGSGMHVAPGALVDDGLLDVLTVEGAGRLRLLGLLAGVFGGWHLRSRTVSRRPAARVWLAWSGDLPFEADGEPLAVASPAEIGVFPAALRVVAPAPGQR